MEIIQKQNKAKISQAAAATAADKLRKAIHLRGHASFCLATGNSQLDFIAALASDQSIQWSRTIMFHLDEYIGFTETHPASFRRYLRERFVDIVHPGTVHYIRGEESNPQSECNRLANLIHNHPLDLACIGIGENGHLAFNDPPADFITEDPYILVTLDKACRNQQFSEGWFPRIEEVPKQAISMSIRQILKSRSIVCTVPGKRKAKAVQNCLQGKISPQFPASILKTHNYCQTYIDEESASLLDNPENPA